ncbi:hypothetical protein SAM23877_3587 [Streptomyces ambofaciens ATCC 23877]|uniref:Uncharacterized protein n=1 Tax=Streptomyces ambofaciens (strain ATCC 23877 / 3486 / DSM 40053 / JCM 4204 / NBRC 12836 / NRRL B-2516) TaxID=278992 RepID=A0A0K2AUE7_STRA7|nr:hypothetical protein SAM23877_3587 [Streptomyces ambofaciens ATCC 23877]
MAGGIAKTVYGGVGVGPVGDGTLPEAEGPEPVAEGPVPVGEGLVAVGDGVAPGWFSLGRCRLTSAVVRPRPPSLISSQAWSRRLSRSK